MTVYLAGPLFSLADRLFLAHLANALRALGVSVTLPQEEAAKIFAESTTPLEDIAQSCTEAAAKQNQILVAICDGTQVDDGTAMEIGIAAHAGNRVLLVLSDIRKQGEGESSLNAMFSQFPVLKMPCFGTDVRELETSIKMLAVRIIGALQ